MSTTILAAASFLISAACFSAPAAADVIFQDGTFSSATWRLEVQGQGAGGEVVTEARDSGGLPGKCMRVTNRVNAGSAATPSAIAGFHRYGADFATRYDPYMQGAITSLSYELAWVAVQGIEPGQWVRVALKQSTFVYAAAGDFTTATPGHVGSTSQSELTSADFSRVDGLPGQPNFSASGPPIRFGFVTANSTTGAAASNTVDYDNFTVTIVQTPPYPCPADFNQDGGVDGGDVEAFFIVWGAGEAAADTNQDGGIDGGDVEAFFVVWSAGGC